MAAITTGFATAQCMKPCGGAVFVVATGATKLAMPTADDEASAADVGIDICRVIDVRPVYFILLHAIDCTGTALRDSALNHKW
ncbi:hypothetical protein ADM96_08250 [Burkholderia sp. ST111]|nr:hypothetical protein ADM96_08250 [Burkholderia sp. ST111]